MTVVRCRQISGPLRSRFVRLVGVPIFLHDISPNVRHTSS
jgi:hypothetical protein